MIEALEPEYFEPGTYVPPPLRMSPSKLDTFVDCGTKYLLHYHCKLPRPMQASAALGTEIHELGENWLVKRQEPHDGNSGLRARSAIPYWPQPGSVIVEGEYHFVIDGIAWTGRIDYHAPTCPNPQSPDEILPFVGDTKSSSNAIWFVPAGDLIKNRQLHVYIEALYPNHPRWVIEHVQILTRGTPTTQRTRVITTRERHLMVMADIRRDVARVLAVEQRMAVDHVATLNDSMLANPRACGKYGGCSFVEQCPFSPQNRGKNVMAPRLNAPQVAPVNPPDATPIPTAVSAAVAAIVALIVASGDGFIPGIIARKAALNKGVDPDAIREQNFDWDEADNWYMPEQAADAAPVSAMPADWTVLEIKPGAWNVYNGGGNIVVKGLPSQSAAEQAALAEAQRLGAVQPPAGPVAAPPPAVKPAQVVAAAPAGNVHAPVTGRPYQNHQHWVTVQPNVQATVNALIDALERANGVLDDEAAGAIIKGTLGIKRLSSDVKSKVHTAIVLVNAAQVGVTGELRFPLGTGQPAPAVQFVGGQPVPAAVAPQPAAAPPAVVPQYQPATVGSQAQHVLYVDCLPVGMPVHSVGRILDAIGDTVSAEMKNDWRCVDFGKGAAAVVADFARLFTSHPTGFYALDSGHQCASGVIAVFERHGALIVRRIR